MPASFAEFRRNHRWIVDCLGVDPGRYLIMPGIVGVVLASVALMLYFEFSALFGSYILAVFVLDVPLEEFMTGMYDSMIRLEQASLDGVFATASITMGQGEICTILTDSDENIRPLVKLFTGLERPSSGSIWVLGEDMANLPKDALRVLRKRIGVAMKNGGLVSNLKAWENILLPLSYHAACLPDEQADGKLMALLDRVGGGFDLTKQPGSLPPYARKLAGLMRAMLMEPDIIIYEAICDGLGGDAKNRLMATLAEFHQEKTGRLSVFIERDVNILDGIAADRVFTLERGCLNARD